MMARVGPAAAFHPQTRSPNGRRPRG